MTATNFLSLYNFKINGIISYLLPQSVIKLLIIIYFGQLPSQELHHLVWRLRHRTMHWSAINWLCLLRLESMIEQFHFRLFTFLNITHQLLITMIAVILESLLLLVQVGSMAVVNMNTENSLKKYMNFFLLLTSIVWMNEWMNLLHSKYHFFIFIQFSIQNLLSLIDQTNRKKKYRLMWQQVLKRGCP